MKEGKRGSMKKGKLKLPLPFDEAVSELLKIKPARSTTKRFQPKDANGGTRSLASRTSDQRLEHIIRDE
jgi:hypothetical protein